MPEVIALHSFTHNGASYARNQKWQTTDSEAAALQRAGLINLVDNSADPRKGSGKKLSASPAAPVSRKQTSTASKRGAKKKPAEPSSSPTPATK